MSGAATGGTFANAATRNATWTAPAEQATEQTYTLTLKVTDNGGKSSSAAVDIRVIKSNVLPTVSIQAVTQEVAGGAAVTFDATADDTDGTIASYAWKAPTNGGTFVDNTIEDATWTAPAEQENAQDYTLTLTVTDNRGGKTTAERRPSPCRRPTRSRRSRSIQGRRRSARTPSSRCPQPSRRSGYGRLDRVLRLDGESQRGHVWQCRARRHHVDRADQDELTSNRSR